MTANSEDLTIEYTQNPDKSISDFRITKGKALYRAPWWKRWLMPWSYFGYRKPTVPYPNNPARLNLYP